LQIRTFWKRILLVDTQLNREEALKTLNRMIKYALERSLEPGLEDKKRILWIRTVGYLYQTWNSSVIGYVKSLCDRWQTVNHIYADITGVGNYIVEDMMKGGIHGVEGILFSLPSKEQMATILRETMRRKELRIPYTPPEFAGQVDLTSELNVEKYELMKTGHIRFSHPTGGHDDVFWALALAVYASRVPEPIHPTPIVDTGKVQKID
jgi:hypothetical protein